MKKTKKMLMAATVFLLLVVVISGLTIAFYVVETEPVLNRMTCADPYLEAMLTEPAWDGVIAYVYGEDGELTGTVKEPDRGTPYGQEMAETILPGMKIPKDPFITNTSLAYDEWVAMKITFVYARDHEKAGQPLSLTDYYRLMDIIQVAYEDQEWELIEDDTVSKIFYYTKPLPRAQAGDPVNIGGKTKPLFQTVDIPSSVNREGMRMVQQMKGFVIYAEGFAAQVQTGDTYADFRQWGVSGGVFFDNSPADEAPADVSAPGITGR